MTEQMVGFFLSWFANPTATGIALAIVFGIIWIFPYQPPLLSRRYWLWLVMIIGAFLTLAAVSFIQIPLQMWIGRGLGSLFSGHNLGRWLYLVSIPQVLVSGLVQEGAKLVPVVVYWWYKERDIAPGIGLAFGAVSGAGFGIFEAQWIHNAIISSGVINWVGFLERFFAVGFHVAAGAIAGYGLARGWGWQFYLLASLLHGLINYSIVLMQAKFSLGLVEGLVVVVALAATAFAFWLRWRQPELEADDIDVTQIDYEG